VTSPGPAPVAVTGAGVKTPAGNSPGELWENLCAARPSAEVFGDDRLPPGTAALVCRVHGFDPAAYLAPVEVRRLDRSHALAIGAAAEALGQCGELQDPARRAVVCGIGLGAAATYEEQVSRLVGRGARGVSPLTIPMVMPSSVAAHLSLRFGFGGPCVTVSAACASGAAAIGEGVELLRRGAAEVCWSAGSTPWSTTARCAASCGWTR
jgi:3-oxoacyl-[acyl-carrier-protein] synthase II